MNLYATEGKVCHAVSLPVGVRLHMANVTQELVAFLRQGHH